MALTVGGLPWAQVVAGDAALGAVIKDAKEQLRALPDGLTYGLLRYLNLDVDLAGSDPSIGFNYLGRLGAAAAEIVRANLWRISQDGVSAAAAAAVPMPLMHTVELNAATVDTETGPQLHANWTWAPSALDDDAGHPAQPVVVRGAGRHLRPRPRRRRRTDALGYRAGTAEPAADRRAAPAVPIADILPLTPLQQGLLFHAEHRAWVSDDVYAVQLDLTVTGAAGPAAAARGGADGGQPPSAPGRPILRRSSTSRCRSSRPIPRWPGSTSSSTPAMPMSRSRSSGCAPPNAPRSATSPTSRPFRVALIRTARRPAPVRADQPPHRAGRLVAADPAARDLRRLLRAATARGGAVPQLRHLAGRPGPRRRPRRLA